MTLMIRSKLGKRLAAFLCAVLILFYCVTFPVQKAEAVSLPVVAGSALVGVTLGYAITAYLNASGIFPFDGSGGDFSSWVSTNLTNLLSLYNATSPVVPITPSLKFFSLGSTLIYPQKSWNALKQFVSWLISRFSIKDNQTDMSSEPPTFPSVPSYNYADPPMGFGPAVEHGLPVYTQSAQYPYASATLYVIQTEPSTPSVQYPCIVLQSGYGNGPACYLFQNYDGVSYSYFQMARAHEAGGALSSAGSTSTPRRGSVSTPLGQATYLMWFGSYVSSSDYRLSPSGSALSGVPVFQELEDAARYFIAFISGNYDSASVTYDTSVVAELPTTTEEYVGLTVSGLDPAVTVEQLQAAIADSVVERLKTVVKPVTVTIEQGTTVDSETGEITGDITIAVPEAETVPSVEALAAPKEFLETMVEAVQTKFPFCLVFDVFNIIKAFDTGPVAPKIVLNFMDPFSKSEYNITVDLAPWDDVAAVVRQLEQMVLFLGFWLNFDKFNVLNIILGQLG